MFRCEPLKPLNNANLIIYLILAKIRQDYLKKIEYKCLLKKEKKRRDSNYSSRLKMFD